MQKHRLTFPGVFTSFWRNRYLIVSLSKREILGRYRGSLLGTVWSLLNPLLMLAVYTFVFSVVFQTKWGVEVESRTHFAVILFCGLIVFSLFSETLNRSPSLILNNPMYVKKVVFPLETLVWVAILTSLFHAAMSFGVLLVFDLIVDRRIEWTVVFVPFILFPLVMFTAGLSWILASLGVFLRDIGQAIGIVTTVLLFMSPIFYPITAVPERYRAIFRLNPLSFVIEQAREVILWGRPPEWQPLAAFTAASLLTAWLGYAWFQKTRKGSADVI